MATVVAIGFALVVVSLLAQVAVWQYARGVVRSGAVEAARSVVPIDSAAEACERRFETVRSQLLGGSLGEQVGPARCSIGEATVIVEVDVRLERWLPISPDWEFTVTATAVREQQPE